MKEPETWIDMDYAVDIDGNGDVVCYYARGSHDPAAFIQQLQYEHERTAPLECIKQRYWRKVPFVDSDGGGLFHLVPSKPGRGAFLVTYVDREDCLDFIEEEAETCEAT